MRPTDGQGHVYRLGRTFAVDRYWHGRLVRATVDSSGSASNADMLLLPDFLRAAQVVQAAAPRGFMLVGRRTTLPQPGPLDFAADWQADLCARAQQEGQLDPPTATDYFVFPRGYVGAIPPFAVGRAAWDNWMLWHARQLGGPLVDCTADILALHQRHDYGHLSGGAQTSANGPEAQHNRVLAGGYRHIWMQQDCSHLLRDGRLRRAWSWPHLYRRAWQAARTLRYRLRDLAGQPA